MPAGEASSLIAEWLSWLSLLGTGLVGGTLLAFSTFIMQALGRLGPERAIGAMQSINEVILRSVFMAVFLGTGAALLAAAVMVNLGGAARTVRVYMIVAALAYVVGVLGVTGARNVPLNDTLAAFAGGDAAGVWRAYYEPWMRWNHVRVVMALTSAAGVAAALWALRR